MSMHIRVLSSEAEWLRDYRSLVHAEAETGVSGTRILRAVETGTEVEGRFFDFVPGQVPPPKRKASKSVFT